MRRAKAGSSNHSTLERHPDIVRAIGMVSIEMGNLEFDMAELLGALMQKSTEASHSIYFTPKATIPRVQVVFAYAKATIMRGSRVLLEIEKLCERSIKVMGARHNYIHAAWGVNGRGSGVVTYSPLPLRPGAEKPVNVQDLLDLIERMRRLREDAVELTAKVQAYYAAASRKSRKVAL